MTVQALLGAALTAQADWHLLAPAHSPSARSNHAMVYDQARAVSVMFGGTAGSSRLGDTWQWDGSDWAQAAPTGATPSPRDGHAMAYDAARQETVLFGGFDGTNQLDDTWVWNGSSWTLRSPANRPPARREHAMAYDPLRQHVVLFGGSGASGNLADTWEWDGSAWLPVFTTTYPQARSSHAITYDPSSQNCVMCGGSFTDNATYSWDGATWSLQQLAHSPGLRLSHAMAFDSLHSAVVLTCGVFNKQTWALANGDWQQVGNSTDSAFPMHGHAMTYDETHGCLVMFGGTMTSSPSLSLSSTWINRPPSTPATANTFGIGCGTPPLTLTTDPAARPILGQTAAVTASNAPTTIGAAALGWNNQTYGPFTLPVTLAGLGMPGCDLWQSADILNLPVSSPATGELRFSLPLPNRIDLIGVHVFAQIYAVAPNENAAWIVISDAVDWMIGDI